MIAIGTSCSYDPSLPLKEEYYLQGMPIESLFTYAMTKRMLLTGLIALERQYGLQYLYLIPSTLYGGMYHEDGRQMHFIFDLVKKIVRGKRFGEPVVLWGNGHQVRELIHVDDFLDAMIVLSDTVSNTWLNVGAGEGHSIRHFAQEIGSLVDFSTAQIQYDESRYVGATSKVLAIQRLKEALPQFTVRPLSKGLAEVVRWYTARE
jgi:GDP-L-fucose synthase